MKLDRSSGGYEIAANVFKYAGIELYKEISKLITIILKTENLPTEESHS